MKADVLMSCQFAYDLLHRDTAGLNIGSTVTLTCEPLHMDINTRLMLHSEDEHLTSAQPVHEL